MPKRDLSSGFDVALPALPPEKPRTVVPDAQAEAFAQGAPTRARGKKVTSSRLRRAELGERINVYVPPTTAKRLRERAFRERRSVSDAVSEALDFWLAQKR